MKRANHGKRVYPYGKTISQHFLGPDIYGIIAVNAAGVRYSFVGDISQF
jgi:hypothetical protein